ncbi:MAG: hypothetical protein MI923_23980 [Phycisphaerales bacterium]|nr:hypothetical protein [Phycisphaerales bacterium]
MPLEGSYRVRVFRPAWSDVRRWFPRTRDTIEIRSHALKLRYWPEKNPTDAAGKLLDLDWCWIKALKGFDVGELRIDDKIGGHDNIRIIFFRGDPKVKAPLPIIWLLAVLQKKSNEWTKANIKTFKARRTLVVERFYKNRLFD